MPNFSLPPPIDLHPPSSPPPLLLLPSPSHAHTHHTKHAYTFFDLCLHLWSGFFYFNSLLCVSARSRPVPLHHQGRVFNQHSTVDFELRLRPTITHAGRFKLLTFTAGAPTIKALFFYQFFGHDDNHQSLVVTSREYFAKPQRNTSKGPRVPKPICARCPLCIALAPGRDKLSHLRRVIPANLARIT